MATRQRDAAPAEGDARPGVPPQPMLTVAAVARRLGVAPSTLRTWDRRYGLGPSGHTAGSHRRYSPADLARLMVMRRLTVEGVPPAEAAQIALSEAGDADDGRLASVTELRAGEARAAAALTGWPAPPGPRLGELDVEGAAQALNTAERLSLDLDDLAAALGVTGELTQADSLAGTAPFTGDSPGPVDGLGGPAPAAELAAAVWEQPGGWQRPRSGGGRVVAMPEGTPAARGLARAAMALDTQESARLLREAIRDQGIQRMWEGLALPVLHSLGDRWRSGGDCLEVEHAFTETLLGVLRGVASGLHRPRNVRPVLLSCVEGEFHTLALHVLAAALSEEDIGCRNLGLGLPGGSLLAAARRCGPSVVFVYARLTVPDPGFLEDLPKQRPAPRVVVGGRGWDPGALPRSARWVGSLGESIDEIVAAVDV